MNYRASPNLVENVTSLFLPDPIDILQYHQVFCKKRSLEPEKRLMLSVLEDAVACYQNYSSARNAGEKALFRDTEGWILEENRDWLFSFDNICEFLGFEPEYIRQGLLGWRQMRLAECSRARGLEGSKQILKVKQTMSLNTTGTAPSRRKIEAEHGAYNG